MRYFLKVGLSMLLSLLFIQTQAQFNVNSLFTPGASGITPEGFRVVSESQNDMIDSVDFEDPTLTFGFPE